MVVVSVFVVSKTVVCSEVVGIVTVSGVVILPEDKNYIGGVAVKL